MPMKMHESQGSGRRCSARRRRRGGRHERPKPCRRARRAGLCAALEPVPRQEAVPAHVEWDVSWKPRGASGGPPIERLSVDASQTELPQHAVGEIHERPAVGLGGAQIAPALVREAREMGGAGRTAGAYELEVTARAFLLVLDRSAPNLLEHRRMPPNVGQRWVYYAPALTYRPARSLGRARLSRASRAPRTRTGADPLAQREPDRRLAGLRVGIFAERCRKALPRPLRPRLCHDLRSI